MTDLPHPRENPDLRGHEEAEKILLDGFHGGRLAHAWLISGPQGIGKATLAYRFARYILAQGGEGAGGLFSDAQPADDMYLAPDNPVFMRTAAGGHADLKAVERTVNEKTGKLRSEIVVDDVRAVGRFFAMTAGEGGWRVAVIDSADEMNTSAANAVLKVLEEPPDRALLLLVSHNPGRLLATIRSRCRKLALQPLPGETVEKLIAEALPDLDAGDASTLAYLADGSPGRALALAAEGGLGLYRDMTGLLETLPRLDIPALHAFGVRLGKAGADEAFSTASNLLRWWLARLILSASGAMAADGPFTAEEKALMDRLGQAAGLDRWFEVWEKINRLLDKTEHANLDRKQVVLNVFLTLENAVSR
jgi:DNA polymerase-3 subunit delta'|tara:strand:+ start:5014 stop:6102 length:1089 start_codon:yes stop_codon:yes gene_type:complete